jgi:hypothetical protein
MPFIVFYSPGDGVVAESKVGSINPGATNIAAVNVTSTAPSANQVLMATDATDAVWTSSPTINITGNASLDLPLTGGTLTGALGLPINSFLTWNTAGSQIPGIGASSSSFVIQGASGSTTYFNPNPGTGTGGIVVCNGTGTFISVGGISGSGVVSGTSANISGATTSGQFTDTIDNLTPGSASYTVSWAAGAVVNLDLTVSTTITFSGAVAGQTLTFFLTQGGSGSNTVAWANTIRWAGGTAPTLTTTTSKTDVISFFYNGSSYFGFVGGLNF